MKRIIALMALVLMFGVAGNASALPIINTSGDGFEDVSGVAYDHYQNSGEFMYFEASNNMGVRYSDGTLETEVEDWLIDNYYITDRDEFTLTDSTCNVTFTGWDGSSDVQITNDVDGEYKSGTWSVSPLGSTISIYAVKGGNGYAMYLVDPANGLGSWSTYDLWDNGCGGPDGVGISHFNGYNTSPVPEPCTMLLFGTGLAGFCLNRRMKKK